MTTKSNCPTHLAQRRVIVVLEPRDGYVFVVQSGGPYATRHTISHLERGGEVARADIRELAPGSASDDAAARRGARQPPNPLLRREAAAAREGRGADSFFPCIRRSNPRARERERGDDDGRRRPVPRDGRLLIQNLALHHVTSQPDGHLHIHYLTLHHITSQPDGRLLIQNLTIRHVTSRAPPPPRRAAVWVVRAQGPKFRNGGLGRNPPPCLVSLLFSSPPRKGSKLVHRT